MDEMKIKLSTNFMRKIVSNLLSKVLFNKFGYKIDIQLNEIEAKTENETIQLHINVDAKMDKDEFIKIVKSIGLN